MASTETRNIWIENSDGGKESGTLRVTQFTAGERTKRALQGLGLCWALALVTVFIPIAHFVLVPGFLIAGPVTAWFRHRLAESTEGAAGRCPTCGQPLDIKLEASDKLPLWTYCSASNDPIQLVVNNDLAGNVGESGRPG